jgi:hypothetical protein
MVLGSNPGSHMLSTHSNTELLPVLLFIYIFYYLLLRKRMFDELMNKSVEATYKPQQEKTWPLSGTNK